MSRIKTICLVSAQVSLTSLLRHISKCSISIVLEQEVGTVLVVTKHIGQGLTDNGPHHNTSPPCTHRGSTVRK